jgi:predicted lipase
MIPSYLGNSDCKQCEVHSGFYNSYNTLVEQSMEQYIIAAVKNHPDYPVVFTGHSLGGALANLFAINFRQKQPRKYVKLYTFGQPRVSNEYYA